MNKKTKSNKPTACCFKDPFLPLVVVTAETRWKEVPRMRHHITQQLMRWFNVLFVEFFPTDEAKESEWSNVQERLLIYKPVLSGSLPVRLYANEPITHTVVNRRYANEIVNAVTSLSSENVLLFNFVYHFPEIMQQKIFCYKAYVCYDEFPKMQRRSYKRNPIKAKYQEKLFQHYENRVAQAADRCFTPHYPLRKKLLKVNSHVEMFFHAHSFPVQPVKINTRPSGSIYVGFAGYINYRILEDWITELLGSEDILLHLIGPKDGPELDRYKQFENVEPVAPVYGDALLEKLKEMDVLIMPYDPNITEVHILTTNSKIFQYVSSGCPIVVSNLEHYIDLPKGVIYKAKSADDFVAKIRQAHAEDCDELRDLRASIAVENTWDKRGEQLHGILKDALGDFVPSLETSVIENL